MNSREEEITFKEFVSSLVEWVTYFLNKWKQLIGIGLIGGVIGLFISLLDKPNYTAKLIFALEEKSGTSSGVGAIASQFGLSLGGSEGGVFAGDNIIELLKSRYIIEKTLLSKAKFNNQENYLINRYIQFNNLEKNWESNSLFIKYENDNREKFSIQQDSILGDIYKKVVEQMLEVKKIDKKLSLISVSFTTKDEKFAKEFCENLVENVTNFYVETKTAKSRSNISLLQFRVDSVKNELDAAMYGRAKFADQNIGLIRQSAAVPRVKQELRVQMLSTMYGELIKNLEFSKLALMREEPLIQIIDKPILPLEYSKIGKTKGVLFTGILFGILGMIYFALRKIIKSLLN